MFESLNNQKSGKEVFNRSSHEERALAWRCLLTWTVPSVRRNKA